MKSILTIAASDPCGGAGIQADLRVFCSHGVAGLSAITAVTVQNTQGVSQVYPIPAETLLAQLEGLLSDCECSAVKIGLLPGAGSVAAVAEALDRYRPSHVILDPVLQSTGGVPFLEEAGQRALKEQLLPKCELVTPNLSEAALLTGQPVQTELEREAAARLIQSMGAGSVLIKGGHLEGEPEDLLLDRDGAVYLLLGNRVDTIHTHGTGCFLSSAIAARLALGDSLLTAVRRAKVLLEEGLRRPIVVGQGRGSPDPMVEIPLRRGRRTHTERLRLLHGLYVLTDPVLQGTRSAEQVGRAAFDGGANLLQLRDKTLSTPELVETARRLQQMALEYGRLFLVNDRVDVAAASDADGVHLGPEDLPPVDARRILGPEKLIGVSVGTVEEAEQAAPFASYLAVGAIFGSKTKLDAGPPVGVERIGEIRKAAPGIPLVAIGGIHVENIAGTATAGADSAAVISAVLSSPDMEAAVRDLMGRFYGTGRPVNG